jgi:CRISPR system Cascade subunit CasB
LEELRDAGDRGALASLRRGLGKPPGTAAEMYPYVVPWIGESASPWEEKICYIIAPLFALHPDVGGVGNMGEALFKVRQLSNSESIEKRFVALLRTRAEDLPDHLRHSVSLCKSKGVPIDWNQLFSDLRYWESSNRSVQRKWATSFWRNDLAEEEKENKNGTEEEQK